MKKQKVMVVDDHPEMRLLLADPLRDADYEVSLCNGGAQAIAALSAAPPDLVLTDLRMKDVDGFDVLAAASRISPPVPVLVMTAFGGVESAVEAIKRGAAHYFTKPFAIDEVLVFVRRALDEATVRAEHREFKHRLGLHRLVGQSHTMRALERALPRLANSDASVLIRGESGTGKELVARSIHELSPRSSQAFVAVNCSAIPEHLLESELFGHARGAFTGAAQARRGLFAEADGGTLFLDEIGDMPVELQSRLLRVLQDGVVRPVGADQSRPTNVRVIAATHQNLEERIASNQFRGDLFYRLNVLRVQVPALRERLEDVPLLVATFLAEVRSRAPRTVVERFSTPAMHALQQRTWPGNVRELQNLVERVAVLVDKPTVELEDIEPDLPAKLDDGLNLQTAVARRLTLRQVEQDYIVAVVKACGGNKTHAADILGIDVSTIHRRGRRTGADDE